MSFVLTLRIILPPNELSDRRADSESEGSAPIRSCHWMFSRLR